MDDASRAMVRAVLVGIQTDRNQLRRRVYDYYADSVMLDRFDWDLDPWDQFLWGP